VKLGLQALRRTQARYTARREGTPTWHSGVRILCYHRIADAPGDLAVSPAAFRRHLQLLASFDAEIVPLSRVLDILGEEQRFVCLTFDDGYRDFAEVALPALRDAGFPATLFVTTGLASGEVGMSWYRRPPPVLGWPELERLAADDLVELGAHTRTHPALPALSVQEAREEIEEPRREIEERTGARVDAFAYPAGLYGAREVELVAGAGYAVAVTTVGGVNLPGTSPHVLRRTVVEGRDSTSLFQAKLNGWLDEPWELRRLLRRTRPRAG
jgi:peptidoglycan/xylan/chitin deacetylase (PgdA/CDA1 family)